jgi:hypothetical protein
MNKNPIFALLAVAIIMMCSCGGNAPGSKSSKSSSDSTLCQFSKIKYEKIMEDGLQKQVVEQYVVDALSFAEAEQRITEQMSQYISGEFEVADVKKAAYKEVFFDDDNAASDRWYKAKLDFITIDEKTEKEKRSRVTYLVQATNLNHAMKNVDTVMGGTMIDYDAASISDTKLVDVFEYGKGNEAEE